MRKIVTRITGGITAVAMMVGLTGCLKDIKDYCEGWADCVEANDNDRATTAP